MTHRARFGSSGFREGQGARRIWPDSPGWLWVSEWNAGKLAVYNPRARRWREWRLPGDNP